MVLALLIGPIAHFVPTCDRASAVLGRKRTGLDPNRWIRAIAPVWAV